MADTSSDVALLEAPGSESAMRDCNEYCEDDTAQPAVEGMLKPGGRRPGKKRADPIDPLAFADEEDARLPAWQPVGTKRVRKPKILELPGEEAEFRSAKQARSRGGPATPSPSMTAVGSKTAANANAADAGVATESAASPTAGGGGAEAPTTPTTGEGPDAEPSRMEVIIDDADPVDATATAAEAEVLLMLASKAGGADHAGASAAPPPPPLREEGPQEESSVDAKRTAANLKRRINEEVRLKHYGWSIEHAADGRGVLYRHPVHGTFSNKKAVFRLFATAPPLTLVAPTDDAPDGAEAAAVATLFGVELKVAGAARAPRRSGARTERERRARRTRGVAAAAAAAAAAVAAAAAAG